MDISAIHFLVIGGYVPQLSTNVMGTIMVLNAHLPWARRGSASAPLISDLRAVRGTRGKYFQAMLFGMIWKRSPRLSPSLVTASTPSFSYN